MITAKKLVLSGEDIFPVTEQLLLDGLKVTFTVSGSSMWPLIRHNRDSVLLARLTRPVRVGDIVLLHVPAPHNHYILHRIHSIQGVYCTTLGDGCLTPDPTVPLNCIVGRVEKVCRGKRTISCDALLIRSLSWFWRFLLPIRPMLLRGIRKAAQLKRVHQ